eukprot:77239-Chlamydomonas_euryale.AAC.7
MTVVQPSVSTLGSLRTTAFCFAIERVPARRRRAAEGKREHVCIGAAARAGQRQLVDGKPWAEFLVVFVWGRLLRTAHAWMRNTAIRMVQGSEWCSDCVGAAIGLVQRLVQRLDPLRPHASATCLQSDAATMAMHRMLKA